MSIIVPNYFSSFRCIADRCKHSCCIGWEIDIDSDTAMYYSVADGDFGDRIRENISKDNPPHFILKQDNKCPFLNEKGLCDIILTLGEDSVCEICREHPRFYNEFDNFTEAGIGLCCEEAARVVLCGSEPFSLIGKYKKQNSKEKEFLNERQKVLNMLQNRRLNIFSRFENLALEYGFSFADFSEEEVKNIYLSLERLDNNWTKALTSAENSVDIEDVSLCLEQFACYLIFRHFKRVMENKEYAKCIKFVLSACFLLWKICGNKTEFKNFARMFSSEVEYSEENMLAIFEAM